MTTETKAITKGVAETVSDLLLSRRDQLASLQSKYLTPERLTRVLVNCITRTPDLAKCSVSSLYRCALTCAELGLEPGGILGHIYLIPYGQEATCIVGYRGMIELARRSRVLADIETHVVHAGDHFEFSFGLNPKLEHGPKLGTTGEPIAVYCIARLRNGRQHVEVMDWPSVLKIRDRSKSKSGPWATDLLEMARKTVVRRTFKYLPTSELLTRAFETEEDEIDVTPALVEHEETATQKAKASVKRRLQIEESTTAEVVDPAIEAQEAAISAEIAEKKAKAEGSKI